MTRYAAPDPRAVSMAELLDLIDYTLLKPERTIGEYSSFVSEALRYGFHSVFVPPCHVPLARGILSGSAVRVGTPVSFPFGYQAPEVKAAETLSALEEGAREVDAVLNISAARSGEWEMVDEDLEAVVGAARTWEKLTGSGPVVVKLILETPYLDDGQKREACRRAAAAGMDFVKTATGFGPGGATPEDVRLMRRAVGDELGVKAAGGVRTWEDARMMLEAGADRIGTSAGPAIVEDFSRARG